MSAFSPALQVHLDSGTTTLSWAWRITRKDGMVLGFTDHDVTLVFDGTSFEAAAGLIASEIRASSDLSVDAQEAQGVLTSDRIAETDIIDGLWDNADIEVWRVNWAEPAQRSLRRRGSLGEIRRGRLSFIAEVRSSTHILGQTVGRTFQGTCDADLGDARCGVNAAHVFFRAQALVSSVVDARRFLAAGLLGFEDGWFSAGKIVWTSGVNVGREVEVALHQLSDGIVTLTLMDQPVRAMANNDAFEITAGCDKSCGTCASKFDNVINFRGFPTIPGLDSVLRYASSNTANDGSVL